MIGLVLGFLLGVAGAGPWDGGPRTAAPPPGEARAPRLEDRALVFGEIDEMVRTGQKARAADGLSAVVEDATKAAFHAEAWARLGGLLEELDVPYGALIAYERALRTDAASVASVAKNAIALADKVGDTALLEPVFAANASLDVDAATRSRMAYLAAREAHHQRSYGTALQLLGQVQAADPFFAEAKNLEGVILSVQGRHKDALIPLLTAQATADSAGKAARLRNAIVLNLARAYFAAENFPRAIENFALVDRQSTFWPEAQFERAWAHFRLTDMNGALAQLHTLRSPFFGDDYFPEADMLRVYSLFLLCKFPDASAGITEFQDKYKPQLEALRSAGVRDPETLFTQMRAWEERGRKPAEDLPRSVTRYYEGEDRFRDSLAAVRHAEDEIERLGNIRENPFAMRVSGWLEARRRQVIQDEGERIRARINTMAEQLDTMLGDSEINKLDMMQFETRLYEQAAAAGAMPEAREQVSRRVRARAGMQYWPYEGEFWADELGYYRVNTKSDCPASLQTGTPQPEP